MPEKLLFRAVAAERMKSLSNIIRKNDNRGSAFFDEDVFYPRLNNQEKAINEAKKKALEIIQDAENQAGMVLKKFEEQAIQNGIQKVSPLSGLLSGLIEDLKLFQQKAITELEPIVVDLAFKISQKVIKEEIRTNPDIVKKNVLAALEKMMDKDFVTICLHPEDKKLLEKHQIEIMKAFRDIEKLTLVADEMISRGGCYIKTSRGDVDGTIETQFAEVGKSFGRREVLK